MKYVRLILAITLVTSCSNKDSVGDAQTFYNESMKIHDEIMPRMDQQKKLT